MSSTLWIENVASLPCEKGRKLILMGCWGAPEKPSRWRRAKPFSFFWLSCESMKQPVLCQQSPGDFRYFVWTHPSQDRQRPPTLFPKQPFSKGKMMVDYHHTDCRVLRIIWKPIFLSYFWIAIEWIIPIPIIKMMCWQWNLAVLYLISNWWSVFLGLKVMLATSLSRDL